MSGYRELARRVDSDAAARIDRQEALHRGYDGPGDAPFIDLGEPGPSLDAASARQFVPARA